MRSTYDSIHADHVDWKSVVDRIAKYETIKLEGFLRLQART
jgi:hypothetical protein